MVISVFVVLTRVARNQGMEFAASASVVSINNCYQIFHEEKNHGIVIKRDDAWLKAREHNGTVLEAAKEKVEVKVAENKRKGKAKVGEECDDIIEDDDLDFDVLSEVFGKEPKGGIRGVGSHITKKQTILLGVAQSKIQESKKATKECQDAIFSHVESRLNSFEGLLLSIASMLPKIFLSSPVSASSLIYYVSLTLYWNSFISGRIT